MPNSSCLVCTSFSNDASQVGLQQGFTSPPLPLLQGNDTLPCLVSHKTSSTYLASCHTQCILYCAVAPRISRQCGTTISPRRPAALYRRTSTGTRLHYPTETPQMVRMLHTDPHLKGRLYDVAQTLWQSLGSSRRTLNNVIIRPIYCSRDYIP